MVDAVCMNAWCAIGNNLCLAAFALCVRVSMPTAPRSPPCSPTRTTMEELQRAGRPASLVGGKHVAINAVNGLKYGGYSWQNPPPPHGRNSRTVCPFRDATAWIR